MRTVNCKAAVAWAANQPLSIETVEVAPPKRGEVRVRIISTSPCHTDATILSGQTIGPYGDKFPIILGHEAAGVVESVGEGVTCLKAGDTVVPVSLPQCRKCSSCKHPVANDCKYTSVQFASLMEDKTSRFTCKGQPIYHFLGISTFSEYTVCSENSLCKINPDIPADVASLFGCCFTTGFGSATNLVKVTPGSTCAVWGLGAVGLSVVIGLKHMGASRIIGIDINPAKFELAKEFGATDCINPTKCSDGVVKCIQQMTDGWGCDFTFECVGILDTVQQAFFASNEGCGVVVVLGGLSNDATLDFEPFAILCGRTIHGGILGRVKMRDWVPKNADQCLESAFPIHKLISHRLKFDEINDAIKLMTQGGVRIALSL